MQRCFMFTRFLVLFLSNYRQAVQCTFRWVFFIVIFIFRQNGEKAFFFQLYKKKMKFTYILLHFIQLHVFMVFTGIYLCCNSIYNVFIKYIVFDHEIHLKYCQDLSGILINRQFNSAMENNFAGKHSITQRCLVRNKIKLRKKYNIRKSPTPLCQRTIEILPSSVGAFPILYSPGVRIYIFIGCSFAYLVPVVLISYTAALSIKI